MRDRLDHVKTQGRAATRKRQIHRGSGKTKTRHSYRKAMRDHRKVKQRHEPARLPQQHRACQSPSKPFVHTRKKTPTRKRRERKKEEATASSLGGRLFWGTSKEQSSETLLKGGHLFITGEKKETDVEKKNV